MKFLFHPGFIVIFHSKLIARPVMLNIQINVDQSHNLVEIFELPITPKSQLAMRLIALVNGVVQGTDHPASLYYTLIPTDLAKRQRQPSSSTTVWMKGTHWKRYFLYRIGNEKGVCIRKISEGHLQEDRRQVCHQTTLA